MLRVAEQEGSPVTATIALLERPVTPTRSIRWARLRPLPLVAILATQVILSVRLIPMTFGGGDESRYIYAGHQLIYELLHGGGSPYYETYFSGAPVIFSPIAAVADHFGGLTGVRLMCLVFMLTATVLLYLTTNRLFGYGAGLAAAGLFAGVGLTHDIGVYGNYDSMALMFVAAATYCAIRAGEPEVPSGWLLVVPLFLVVANTTKYMTVLFDPVVIGLAALRLRQGWRPTLMRLITLGMATGLSLLLLLFIAGAAYLNGVMFTTLGRKVGKSITFGGSIQPDSFIIGESWHWIGIILSLGACAILLALLISQSNKSLVLMLALLVVAGILVTVEALHLHADESMRQHDTFGVWFTCIAAGYTLTAVPQNMSMKWTRYAVGCLAALTVLLAGAAMTKYDVSTYEGGKDPRLPFFAAIQPYLYSGKRVLVGGYAVFQMAYVDHINIPWYNLYDGDYVKYAIPGHGGDSHGQKQGLTCFTYRPQCMYLEGNASLRATIHAHYFSIISLVGDEDPVQERFIERLAEGTPGYTLLTGLGHAPTWIYLPDYRTLFETACSTVRVDAPGCRAAPGAS
jgi:4-amino-4-deoxy-L-arabinose transferase-like glycosyltransferase